MNLDARDDNNATPLIRAAKHGDEWAVTTLLEAGASLYVEDSDGCNPLHGAVRVEGATITKALLAKDTESKLVALKDDQGRTALTPAQTWGRSKHWRMQSFSLRMVLM